jgi:putative flippase GtrA
MVPKLTKGVFYLSNTEKPKLSKRDNIIQAVKFALFSASAGLIQLGSFSLLDLATGWSYWPKYLIALTLSVLYNFTLNRRFTFKSANNVPLAMLLVALYYAVFTPLSTWWGDALDKIGWNEYLILALTMLANFVTEFLYQRFVVFGKSINTNDLAKKEQMKNKAADEDAANN